MALCAAEIDLGKKNVAATELKVAQANAKYAAEKAALDQLQRKVAAQKEVLRQSLADKAKARKNLLQTVRQYDATTAKVNRKRKREEVAAVIRVAKQKKKERETAARQVLRAAKMKRERHLRLGNQQKDRAFDAVNAIGEVTAKITLGQMFRDEEKQGDFLVSLKGTFGDYKVVVYNNAEGTWSACRPNSVPPSFHAPAADEAADEAAYEADTDDMSSGEDSDDSIGTMLETEVIGY